DTAAKQLQMELELRLTPADGQNGVAGESGRGN
ncbi:MAG: hypothetical protein RLZZ536_1858, partial [Planctomycetota bacterium]